MSTKFLALAAVAGVIALSGTTTPALAVCNPGTPNCIRADSPWLAKAKAQVHQGDGNFNCDPGPDGFCSKSIPSGPKPATSAPVTPQTSSGMVTVAPPIQ
jgi:hypothetical protein